MVAVTTAAATGQTRDSGRSFLVDQNAGRIGQYSVANGTLPAAIRLYGQPTAARDTVYYALPPVCVARWSRNHVEIRFDRPCASRPNCVRNATVSGHRWHTREGLFVGDSAVKLYELYPDTLPRASVAHPGTPWRWNMSPSAKSHLEAKLVRRRVSAIRLWSPFTSTRDVGMC